MPTYPRYNIYKLDRPTEQVGLPSTQKWAVGVQWVPTQGFGFEDAFRTKTAARAYLSKKGVCILCGEVTAKTHPRCECERIAAEPL